MTNQNCHQLHPGILPSDAPRCVLVATHPLPEVAIITINLWEAKEVSTVLHSWKLKPKPETKPKQEHMMYPFLPLCCFQFIFYNLWKEGVTNVSCSPYQVPGYEKLQSTGVCISEHRIAHTRQSRLCRTTSFNLGRWIMIYIHVSLSHRFLTAPCACWGKLWKVDKQIQLVV